MILTVAWSVSVCCFGVAFVVCRKWFGESISYLWVAVDKDGFFPCVTGTEIQHENHAVDVLCFRCIDRPSCPDSSTFTDLPAKVEEAGGELTAGGWLLRSSWSLQLLHHHNLQIHTHTETQLHTCSPAHHSKWSTLRNTVNQHNTNHNLWKIQNLHSLLKDQEPTAWLANTTS